MSDAINNGNDQKGKWGMHYGASPILFKLAEKLRGRMTAAEKILWEVLQKNDWQLNFRRQHPIAIYIADFYCHKIKLAIEIDGGYHDNEAVKINNESREKDIGNFGIKVLRFKNEEVINYIETVITKINSAIASIQRLKMEEIGSKGISKNTMEEDADSSKTSPPRRTGGETDSSNNSPLGDGGGLPPLFVIKIGGNIIDDDASLQSFLKDFASIHAKKILVHGGGKIATKIGEQLGIQSKYINGRRITDAATMDLVTMVYGGLVNKKIVAKLQSMQCNAIGLTGADANVIPATKRPVIYSSITTSGKDAGYSKNSPPRRTADDTGYSKTSPAQSPDVPNPVEGLSGGDGGIDYGFAGDIDPDGLGVDNLAILLSNNFTPVFAPLTHDGNGQMLNTNADTIASALAVALSEIYNVRLIYCFEKKGVLENVEDEGSVIPLITKGKYLQLKQDNKLFEGILPKINNAFAAIDNGVMEVLIGDAKDLLQNVTVNTRGTLIK